METTTKVPPPVEYMEQLKKELDNLSRLELETMGTLENTHIWLVKIQKEKHSVIKELLDDTAIVPEPLELTPEMTDEAISALKAEFDKDADDVLEAGYIVQENIDFAALEAKLRAEENKAVLTSLYRMVQAGSCPAVVCEEGERFCIAETFVKTLPKRANCVYDRKAQIQVGCLNCNGNAVDQAKAIGIHLMEKRIADTYLVAFPQDTNQSCYDFLAPEVWQYGIVPCLYRNGDHFSSESADFPCNCLPDRGWRGTLWV